MTSGTSRHAAATHLDASEVASSRSLTCVQNLNIDDGDLCSLCIALVVNGVFRSAVLSTVCSLVRLSVTGRASGDTGCGSFKLIVLRGRE
jgi:hypothetical protein